MFGRRLAGLMIPVWIWAAALMVGFLAAALLVTTAALGGTFATVGDDLHYQCDSVVGPDPSSPRTDDPGSWLAGDDVADEPVSPTPTVNPYAGLTVEPGDTSVPGWQRACVSAMKAAPYQLLPVRTSNSGPAVECARALALAQVGRSMAEPGGSASNTGMPMSVELSRYLILQASSAQSTGSCDDPAAAGVPSSGIGRFSALDEQGGSAMGTCSGAHATGPAVILPDSLAGQAVCGQRVDPGAASAGDLVFWNYADGLPSEVGVVVDSTRIVSVDSQSGRVVEESLPTSADARVKRVLSEGP